MVEEQRKGHCSFTTEEVTRRTVEELERAGAVIRKNMPVSFAARIAACMGGTIACDGAATWVMAT